MRAMMTSRVLRSYAGMVSGTSVSVSSGDRARVHGSSTVQATGAMFNGCTEIENDLTYDWCANDDSVLSGATVVS